MQKFKETPPRLDRVYQSYDSPLYFVTICTMYRQQLLANEEAHQALTTYAMRGQEENRASIGRYVIMPDHMHLFVRLGFESKLNPWASGLKRAISSSLQCSGRNALWQPGFFDHMLRSNESYSEKWSYVRMNPVRAGLVANPEDWPYQGEIVLIDRV